MDEEKDMKENKIKLLELAKAVEVTTEEVNQSVQNYYNSSKVKELQFEMNTGDLGHDLVITKNIRGILDCVIVSTEGNVNLIITFEDAPTIEIFNTHNKYLYGDTYLPLRISALDNKYEMFNYSQEKWCLNNKLRFEIDGAYNTKVIVKVRYY